MVQKVRHHDEKRRLAQLIAVVHNRCRQVGFPAAARANEKQMVLVLGKRTLPHPFHGVLQKLLALTEDELEVPWIGAAGSEHPNGLATVRPLGRG